MGKARRKAQDDSNENEKKLYLEESVLERKYPEADLKVLVELPAGLCLNEWLASHTLALFENVNLVYGTVSEFCTPSSCPEMTGPGTKTYLWYDEKGKKTKIPAPQYIDYVMTFIQRTVSDESIFPTKFQNYFPSSFEVITKKILRLLFHVIAHLYAAHFRELALLGLHAHMNLTFAHLTAFHRNFNLIEPKETEVLLDLEVALRLTDEQQQQQEQQQTSNNNINNSSNSNMNSYLNSNSCSTSMDIHDKESSSASSLGFNMNVIDGDQNSIPIVKQPLESGCQLPPPPSALECDGASSGGGRGTPIPCLIASHTPNTNHLVMIE